ncbi:MAG: BREX protein BrxB domain-containing protein [Planctomycetota bacterium]
MSTDFDAKFCELRARLISPGGHKGALLFVYDPEGEHVFRRRYDLVVKEMEAEGIPHRRIPLHRLPFEVLEEKQLLERAFELEFTNPAGLRQNLAALVHRTLVERIDEATRPASDTVLLLERTAALYPWVSYSAVLDEIENRVVNPLLLPFPGYEQGPLLRFLGEKDGYNYRATRI